MNAQSTHNPGSGYSPASINWKMVIRFSLVALLMPLILMLAAGRVDWWQGWVYIILTILPSLVSRYLLYLKNPALIAERARFTQSDGIKDWDKHLVIWIAIAGPLAFMITAGLDKRFGGSPEVALPVQLGAILIFLLGYGLATWAMIVNSFFASVVRIQTDRGQTVVTSGPYRLVRHPGYSGSVMSWLVSPLVLGSLWSFIPVALIILLFIVRTALEDRTLQNELPGYKEYAMQVRYRLLPGIW